MNPSYCLHGSLTAQAGKGSQLSDILIQASNLIKTTKGNRLYCVSIQDELPDTIWVTEIWDSAEDHTASLKVDGVMELISQAIPLLAEKPTKGQELRILGGVELL